MHLIMSCKYSKQVWFEVEGLSGLQNAWNGNSIEEALRIWCLNKETKRYRALPIIISLGVWLAKNTKLFEDKDTLTLKCVVQRLNILSTFSWYQKKKDIKQNVEEVFSYEEWMNR